MANTCGKPTVSQYRQKRGAAFKIRVDGRKQAA